MWLMKSSIIFDSWNNKCKGTLEAESSWWRFNGIQYRTEYIAIWKRGHNEKYIHQETTLSIVMHIWHWRWDTYDRHEQSFVQHDEADVTIVSYTLNAANNGYQNIRILRDDTDVDVLLVCWTWKSKIKTEIQMDKWEGSILHINAVVDKLRGKCVSILAMHSHVWLG